MVKTIIMVDKITIECCIDNNSILPSFSTHSVYARQCNIGGL